MIKNTSFSDIRVQGFKIVSSNLTAHLTRRRRCASGHARLKTRRSLCASGCVEGHTIPGVHQSQSPNPLVPRGGNPPRPSLHPPSRMVNGGLDLFLAFQAQDELVTPSGPQGDPGASQMCSKSAPKHQNLQKPCFRQKNTRIHGRGESCGHGCRSSQSVSHYHVQQQSKWFRRVIKC